MSKKVECPKCIGQGKVMQAKETRGFDYPECTLCEGTGKVSSILEEDFILSLNEDSLETNDDW